MRKLLLLYLLLCFILIFSGACTTNNQKTQPDLFYLINKAPDNSTIHIPKYHYVINTPIIIRGRKGLNLIWEDGSMLIGKILDMPIIIIDSSKQIYIKNLCIKHFGEELKKKSDINGIALIHIRNSEAIIIDNCEINANHYYDIGVGVANAEAITIRRCEIRKSTATALRFDNSGKIRILQSIIEQNASLIKANNIAELIMTDNITRNNGGYYNDGRIIKSPGRVVDLNKSIDELP